MINLAPLVRSLGYDPEPIFRRCGFELGDFNHPDHRLPYQQGLNLLADCAQTTHCAHFGLLLGEMTEVSLIGLVGFLVRSAPTVRQAMYSLVENLDLQEDAGSVVFQTDNDYASLAYSIHIPGLRASEHVYDLCALIMFKVVLAACGDRNIPMTVKLVRSAPLDVRPYRRLFGNSLFFNSTECSVSFPKKCLDWVPPSADRWLFQHLEQEAYEIHSRHAKDMIGQLPVVLRHGLLTGKTKAGDIADRFGVGERTLHRRLRSAGVTFREELDRARQSVSEELLSKTNLPVYDIAQTLGYSESSGFIRAFHRWSGTSPSNWRKEQGQSRSLS